MFLQAELSRFTSFILAMLARSNATRYEPSGVRSGSKPSGKSMISGLPSQRRVTSVLKRLILSGSLFVSA